MRTVQAPLDRAVAIADAAIYRCDPDQRARSGGGRPGGLVGVLTPAAYAARHPDERAHVHAECLLAADPDAVLTTRVRWLQITTREQQVLRSGGTGGGAAFDADADDQAEFLPHEVDEAVAVADLLAVRPQPMAPPPSGGWPRGWLPHLSAPRPNPWEPAGAAAGGPGSARSGAHTIQLSAPSGRRVRIVDHGGGAAPTRITWDSWSARAELRLSAGLYPGPRPLLRLRLRAELVNTSGWPSQADEAGEWIPAGWTARTPHRRALHHALIAVHVVLGTDRGRFVSLTAPPGWARDVARDCVNDGLWPAVVGGPADPTAVLIAPVRIPDGQPPPSRSGA